MPTRSKFRIHAETIEKDVAAITRIAPELAKAIGLNECIILMQMDFWIGSASSDNYIDGHWWTWQSVREMKRKAFPYWGKTTINRIIQRMVDAGYLLVGNYNKRENDATQWYAIDEQRLLEILKERGVKGVYIVRDGEVLVPELSQNGTGASQSGTEMSQLGTTLPESTSENTTESMHDSCTPAATPVRGDESPPAKLNCPSSAVRNKPFDDSADIVRDKTNLEKLINARLGTFPGGKSKRVLHSVLEKPDTQTGQLIAEPTPADRYDQDAEYRKYCDERINYYIEQVRKDNQPDYRAVTRLAHCLYGVFREPYGYYAWLKHNGQPVPGESDEEQYPEGYWEA